MKIYPRSVVIHEGNATPAINIRNSAADERVLLFKIRRSKHKMVEFSPKFGCVESGTTCTIRLKVVDDTISRTKLLVKLVVLKRSMCKDGDFEANWQLASERNGEVKKIIDVVRGDSGSTANPHWKDSTTTPSRKNVRKRVAADHTVAPAVGRARSYDSADAHSTLSEMSCSVQSLQSGAFYSPSNASSCSPPRGAFSTHGGSPLADHPDAIHGCHPLPENMSVSGSAFDFDGYSIAASGLEDLGGSSPGVCVAAVPAPASALSAAPGPHDSTNGILTRQQGTAEDRPHKNDWTANAATDSTEADHSALLELVQRLSRSPNTATLLVGLLRSVDGSPTARGPPPATPFIRAESAAPHTAFSSVPQREPPRLSAPISAANTEGRIAQPSRAEQLRRFIEAEDGAAFPSVRQTHTNGDSAYENEVGESKKTEDSIHACSRMVELGAAKGRPAQDDSVAGAASGGAVMLEVCGGDAEESPRGLGVTDEEFVRIAEARLEEAVEGRVRVAAMQVTSCRISSLAASVGALFEPDNRKVEQSEPQVLRDKLTILRAAFLEDGLRHLSVNDCFIPELDGSVNRFRHLLSLNLASCCIQHITAPLQLPHLRSLDLSNNEITSLDYLQLLTSLSSLHVANNRITSLSVSVNMLVSLSRTLTLLDMSGNPVCGDHHYAQEVVHVLPRLKVFDGCDLQAMSLAYSYSHAARGGPASSRASSAPRGGGPSVHGRRRLPDLPVDARRARGTLRSSQETRRDFERRLRSALLHRQRGIHASSPAIGKTPDQTEHLSPIQPGHTDDRSRDLRKGRYAVMEDEQELEMRCVEDSIQELSRSFSEKSSRVRPHKASPVFTSGDLSGHSAPATATSSASVATARARSDRALSPSQRPTAPASAAAPSLIQRWGEHPTTKEVTGFARGEVPPIDDNSTLLDGTESLRLRRHLHGVADRSTRFPEHPHYAPNGSLYSSTSLQSRGRSGRSGSADRGRRRSGSGASLANSAEFSTPAGPKRSADDEWRGYFSESEVHSRSHRAPTSARRAAKNTTLSEEQFLEMQERERYGYWHPRYRVPKPVFGFSRPFAHRHRPALKDHAPLFEATVQRLRNGFRLAPSRGTFPRAGKGLPSEWYPMDVEEADAVRRHGYFNETIGEITQGSFLDPSIKRPRRATGNQSWSELQGLSSVLPGQSGMNGSVVRSPGAADATAPFLTEAHVSPRGSTSISPQKPGRRSSWGPHMSRFDPAASVVQLPDDFSGFRKWHQGLFDAVLDSQLEYGADRAVSPPGDPLVTAEASPSSQRSLVVEPVCEGAHQSASAAKLSAQTADTSSALREGPPGEERESSGTLAEPCTSQAPGASARTRPVEHLLVERPQASPPRFNSSFEEDLRVYASLPDFPEPLLFETQHQASAGSSAVITRDTSPPLGSAQATSPNGQTETDDTLLSPSMQQLSAITEKIDAEEAELANYLSWLESQQLPAIDTAVPVAPATSVVPVVLDVPLPEQMHATAAPDLSRESPGNGRDSRAPPLPAETTAARLRSDTTARPQGHTGIPRYMSNMSRSAPTTASGRVLLPADTHHNTAGRRYTTDGEPSDRLFSPRDAAMRAEQPPDDADTHRDLVAVKSGRSAFQSRPASFRM